MEICWQKKITNIAKFKTIPVIILVAGFILFCQMIITDTIFAGDLYSTMYLVDDAAPGDGPSSPQTSDTSGSWYGWGTSYNRKMAFSGNSSELSFSHDVTNPDVTDNVNVGADIWVSPPLESQTIPSMTWAVYLKVRQDGDGQSDNYGRATIYLWRPGQGKVFEIGKASDNAGLVSATATNINFTISGGSTDTVAGDYICLEVEFNTTDNTPDSQDPDTFYVYYNIISADIARLGTVVDLIPSCQILLQRRELSLSPVDMD